MGKEQRPLPRDKKRASRAQRKLKRALKKLAGPSVCSEETSVALWEYYRNVVLKIWKALKPQQDKINHHIGSTVGFGRATFRGVFRDFPTIPSSAFNKSRTDRPRQSTEESSAPTSLHQRKSSKKLLREIDGTKSEQAFVDLGNFCSLQLENKAPLPYSQIWLG